jgi:hypothetical protein
MSPVEKRVSEIREKTSSQVGKERITKSDEQWKVELSEEEYRVMRKAGTEPRMVGRNSGHFLCLEKELRVTTAIYDYH